MVKQVRLSLVLLLLLQAASWSISPTLTHSRDVTLAWDANTEPDLAGYKIYSGPTSGSYNRITDVGKVTTYTVTGLPDANIYFAATAYNATEESGYSNEIISFFNLPVPLPATNVRWNYIEVTMATFGDTSEYTTNVAVSGGYICGKKFTLSEAATVTDIYLYTSTAYANVKARLAIYQDGSPNKTLKAETAELDVPTTLAWIHGAVNVELSAGNYWIVANNSNELNFRMTGSGSDPYYSAQTYGAFPATATIDTAYSQGANLSAYAVYTPSGGGVSKTILMNYYRQRRN